jgi:3-dehydroquinate synthetase
MVDASLGGKTGFDLPSGKNLVGAFHSPSVVYTDVNTLKTLPETELRSGMAEVVKHGVIADPGLFYICTQGWHVVTREIENVVKRAAAAKVRVIQIDPYEREERAALNFGHTLGHAIEQASGYQIRHGEAVAIGMVAATRLSARLGIAEPGLESRLVDALLGLGLPTEIPSQLARNRIITAMGMDKKRVSGVVRFVLPVKIGEVKIGITIDNPGTIFD